jgi:hypothetical protein|tara:strand:+ start:82 stop:342 length:261 start_codon:yes stop_codon:yes gene_type:complete
MSNLKDKTLRLYIRFLIESVIDEDDETKGEEKDEASVAGAIGGVTTPLGTGPNYPNPGSGKRVPPYVAAGKAFGNAKLAKKKKKKK